MVKHGFYNKGKIKTLKSYFWPENGLILVQSIPKEVEKQNLGGRFSKKSEFS